MTLPKRILDKLAAVDSDRASAVVKVTEAAMGTDRRHCQPVELVEMSPRKSLIVVGPSRTLSKIPWLKMIEITPTRYLLTIPSGTSIEALEVALHDLVAHPEFTKNDDERVILQELLRLISHQRRARRLSKAEILIIDSTE